MCVAIAAKGNEHMAVLSGLAQILMEPEQAEALRSSSNVDEVLKLLSGIGEDDDEIVAGWLHDRGTFV